MDMVWESVYHCMISLQKKFLFIHVPKTGGNSIQNILNRYSEDDIVALDSHHDGVERFEVRNRFNNIEKHSTLSDYRRELDSAVFSSLFKFATIRNPWDMMVSYYFSPHRNKSQWDKNEFLLLVDKVPTISHFISLESKFRNLIKPFGFGKRLDGCIDYLIRFEHIEEGFKDVCQILDIEYEQLPKRNASSREHYSYYYDRKLEEAVRNKFRAEIEYGEYEFERRY